MEVRLMGDIPIERVLEIYPSLRLLINQPTKNLDISSLGGFGLEIPSEVVWSRSYVVNTKFFEQLSNVAIDERSTIFRKDALGNVELITLS